jgi:hypothetical protein
MQFAVPDWLEHHHSTAPLQTDADAELEDEWLNPTEVTLEVSNCLSTFTAARRVHIACTTRCKVHCSIVARSLYLAVAVRRSGLTRYRACVEHLSVAGARMHAMLPVWQLCDLYTANVLQVLISSCVLRHFCQ